MSEPVDTPDEYVVDGLETHVDEIDGLVNPEEAGQSPPGTRAGTQEQRAERWERLTSLFTDLRDEIVEYDHVLKMKAGYVQGSAATDLDHKVGFVIVTGVGGFTGGLPDEITEKTRNEELRLLDTEVGDRYSEHGEAVSFLFSLPAMEPEEPDFP
ncbi:hypothetical protein [Halobacterium rubrum]|uniref:hypothetical protein n=1 Tax=Halobacterium TaxID=2239 RepID=UPI001F4330F9|nr:MULTISPECIES: hypothetical protein [Halobacterium]MDH5021838.1 hypothetical protein [Halobacterium rubrum]